MKGIKGKAKPVYTLPPNLFEQTCRSFFFNELEILLKITIAEISDYCELKMNVM